MDLESALVVAQEAVFGAGRGKYTTERMGLRRGEGSGHHVHPPPEFSAVSFFVDSVVYPESLGTPFPPVVGRVPRGIAAWRVQSGAQMDPDVIVHVIGMGWAVVGRDPDVALRYFPGAQLNKTNEMRWFSVPHEGDPTKKAISPWLGINIAYTGKMAVLHTRRTGLSSNVLGVLSWLHANQEHVQRVLSDDAPVPLVRPRLGHPERKKNVIKEGGLEWEEFIQEMDPERRAMRLEKLKERRPLD